MRLVQQHNMKGNPINEIYAYADNGKKIAEIWLKQDEVKSERGIVIQKKRDTETILINGRFLRNIKSSTKAFTPEYYLERILSEYLPDVQKLFKKYPEAQITEYLAV